VILDSSAIIAILLREPGFEALVAAVAQADLVAVGAPTLVETGIVLTARLGSEAAGILGDFVAECDVTIVPFDIQHWRLAVDAFDRFGKGRHGAALNFGDCMTYAVASVAGQPLLFTGDDFGQTDLVLAQG
jgi:ribonuclease VapC